MQLFPALPRVAGIFAVLAGMTGMLAAHGASAAAAEYWPLQCRGPLPQIAVEKGLMVLAARPGQRAGQPQRGECVWLDRGIDLQTEAFRGRNMVIRLPIAGYPILRNRGGRMMHNIALDNRAQQLWDINARGGIFRIGAQRLRKGLFRAQYAPTAWPRPAARVRPRVQAEPAPPAPGARRRAPVRATEAPAEDAPLPPGHVRVRPAR